MRSNRTKNVVWHELEVTAADLEALHGHRGVTVWFTGLPSSGKSTLANAVARALLEIGVSVTVLDGDNVRHGLNANLGFSPDDRTENIRRIGEVAKLFSAAAVVNLTAFISPYIADRAAARRMQPESFVEVFCDATLESCEQRDPKGMYRAARAGRIKGFTGIDAPYERPTEPELWLRTDELSIEECVESVVLYLHAHRFIDRDADTMKRRSFV